MIDATIAYAYKDYLKFWEEKYKIYNPSCNLNCIICKN